MNGSRGMDVLVMSEETEQYYLVRLDNEGVVREICDLVHNQRRREAIKSVLSRGRVIGEVTQREFSNLTAELMITPEGSYWNAM